MSEQLKGVDIETPEMLASEINKAFSRYNDLLSKTASKDDWATLLTDMKAITTSIDDGSKENADLRKNLDSLTQAAKHQGERLEQLWKQSGSGGQKKMTIKEAIYSKLKDGVFNDLAERKASNAVMQLDEKALSFLGTDQAGEAVQAWMPFELPVYPYLEPVDVRLVFPTGTSGSDKLEYPQEKAYTDAMGMLAENAASAETAMTFEMVEVTAKRTSTHIKVSRWALRNINWLANHISTRLMQHFIKLLNTQVLVGPGTGNTISGVMTTAGTINFTGTIWENKLAHGTGNFIDVLIQAKGFLYNSQNVMANTVFLNPGDWSLMTSTKTTTADWVSGPPIVTLTPEGYTMVNGMILLPFKDIPAGQYMIGGVSSSNIELLFNGPIEILATDSDSDDFQKNLVTIKLEAATLLPIYHEGAFAKGTFATDLAVIEKAATNP